MRHHTGFAWLVGLALVVAACGGSNPAEQFLESQAGIDNVNIDDGSGSFSVTDDEGNTISISGDEESLTVTGEDGDTIGVFGGGEIPADFPIPMPPGGTVTSVVVVPPTTLVAMEYSPAEYDYEDLVAFYDTFAEKGGITVVGRTANETAPAFVAWFLQENGQDYSIAVNDEVGGSLEVQLSVTASG